MSQHEVLLLDWIRFVVTALGEADVPAVILIGGLKAFVKGFVANLKRKIVRLNKGEVRK